VLKIDCPPGQERVHVLPNADWSAGSFRDIQNVTVNEPVTTVPKKTLIKVGGPGITQQG